MRGFLGLVLLLLASLVVVALVVVPMVVRPMVVDEVLAASPFGDQPLDVEVDINPLTLLQGSIDRVRITGSDLETEGIEIGGLDVTLSDVSSGTHAFGSLSGRLTGVALPFVQGATLGIDSVELSGPSGDVEAVARFDLRGGLALIGNGFADAGIAVDSLELTDGGVAFVLFNQRVQVPVTVEDGALLIPDVAGGQLVIVEPGPDDPWRITGVTVTPSGMDVQVSLEPDAG